MEIHLKLNAIWTGNIERKLKSAIYYNLFDVCFLFRSLTFSKLKRYKNSWNILENRFSARVDGEFMFIAHDSLFLSKKNPVWSACFEFLCKISAHNCVFKSQTQHENGARENTIQRKHQFGYILLWYWSRSLFWNIHSHSHKHTE